MSSSCLFSRQAELTPEKASCLEYEFFKNLIILSDPQTIIHYVTLKHLFSFTDISQINLTSCTVTMCRIKTKNVKKLKVAPYSLVQFIKDLYRSVRSDVISVVISGILSRNLGIFFSSWDFIGIFISKT